MNACRGELSAVYIYMCVCVCVCVCVYVCALFNLSVYLSYLSISIYLPTYLSISIGMSRGPSTSYAAPIVEASSLAET